MAMAKKHMRLTGVKRPVALQERFGSHMVDVAYVVEIGAGFVLVEMDNGIDLGDEGDRDWAVGLVRAELKNCGETEVQIEVLD